MDKIYTYRGGLDFSSEPHRIAVSKVLHHDVLLNTVQLWGQSYYHFLCEILPKLAVVMPLLVRFPDCKVLIPSIPRLKEFLDIAGFQNHDRFVTYDEGQNYAYSARALLLPRATLTGMPSRTALKALRRLVFKKIDQLDVVVLIRRQKGRARALNDHDRVLYALRDSFPQFKVIEFLGSESVGATRDLFARAAVIVGPHGAGFANILFRYSKSMHSVDLGLRTLLLVHEMR